MDGETREAIAELKDGIDNLATLMAQLAQLICYAEGVELTAADDDADAIPVLRN